MAPVHLTINQVNIPELCSNTCGFSIQVVITIKNWWVSDTAASHGHTVTNAINC